MITRKPVTAVCPFCKSFINTNQVIYGDTNISENPQALEELFSADANKVKCEICGKAFFYEHSMSVINSRKGYMISSVPQNIEIAPVKSAIFHILKKEHFRFRKVSEFIFLSEKVRIFESELDDRVIEVIKYKYIAEKLGLGIDTKIILNGVNGNGFVFTVYDGNDICLATHRVSTSAYATESKQFTKEVLHKSASTFEEINLNWAAQYTKERAKNEKCRSRAVRRTNRSN